MLIKTVRLNNIRSYSDGRIDFPSGCIMLSGDIGSGKSTILLAIEFALFGLTSDLDGSAILRNGKSYGEVELRLLIEGKDVTIKRTLKRVKDSVRQDSGHIIVQDRKYEGTPIELKARILELLGYPKELLTRSKSLIYRYTVYTPQEEMKMILQENNPTRLDTLRKVFQIDKYKRVKENAQIVARTIKEKTREIAARCEDLPLREARKNELEKELNSIEAQILEILPKIRNCETVIAEKRALAETLEQKGLKLAECKKNIEVLNSRINERNRIIRETERDIATISIEISELKKKEQAAQDLQLRFLGMIATANIEKQKAMAETSQKAEIKKKLLELEEELNRLMAEIRKNQYIAENSKKTITGMSSLQTCPTCLQPVSQDHKSHIIKTEEEKILEATTTASKSIEARKAAQLALSKLNEKLESAYETEKRIAILNSELDSCEQIRECHAEPVELDIIEMRKINRLIRESLQTKERIKDKESLITAHHEKTGTAITELSEMKKAMELENSLLTELAGTETIILNTRKELEELTKIERQYAVQKASLNADQQSIKKNIEILNQEIEKKQAMKKDIDRLKGMLHWMESHFIELAETIERQTMLKVYNEFNTFFQDWFNVLMEDPTMSIRLNEEFTPVIEQNGYELPFENLSGGERTSCALAYRLALNKVINDLITNIKTRDLIILDEPTDGFSSEQLERVRDVISQLKMKQIILVSHETKIESYADTVIRIVKEEHSSRMIG